MNYIMRTIYLDNRMIAELRTLSKRTGIPQAVFMREAVDIVLKKYKKQLSGSRKKGKAQFRQVNERKRLKLVPKIEKS